MSSFPLVHTVPTDAVYFAAFGVAATDGQIVNYAGTLYIRNVGAWGAIGAGTSSQTVFLGRLSLAAISAPEGGCDTAVVIAATGAGIQSTACGLQAVTAGAGHGFALQWITPAVTGGTLTGAFELDISNADGTEKLTLYSPLDLDLLTVPSNFAGWTVGSNIGTDLAVAGGNATVDSTAGGEFMATLILNYTGTGLAA